MGTALLSMIFFMAQNGVSPAVGQIIFFAVITIAGILISVIFYSKIKTPPYDEYIKAKKRDVAIDL